MRSRALIRKHSGNFAFLNCIREDACFIIDKFSILQTRSAGTKLALIKNIKLVFLNSVPQQNCIHLELTMYSELGFRL
jgi:hypothetical protein